MSTGSSLPGVLSRTGGRICLAAAGLVVAFACLRTIAVPSFWGALAAGRSILDAGLPRSDTWTFTAAGQPWIDVRWLHDVLLFLAWKTGGAALVILAKTAAVALAFLLAGRAALRHAPTPAIAMACVLLTASIAPRLDATPAVLAMPLAAAMILILTGPPQPRRDYGILVPLQILWLNLDPSALLGPAIAAVAAVATWAEYRRGALPGVPKARIQVRMGLPLALAAACLATPYGPAHLRFVFTHAGELFTSGGMLLLPSTAPYHVAPWTQAMLTAVLIVCAVGLIAPRQPLPAHPLAVSLLGIGVLFKAPEAVPLFAVLVLPFLAFSLLQTAGGAASMVRSLLRYPRGIPPAAALVPVLAATIGALATMPGQIRRSGSLARFGLAAEDVHLASGVADVLARPGAPARVFCLPADGACLAWRLPGRPVFSDLREGLRTDEFNAAVARFLSGDAASQAALSAQWNLDAVLLNSLTHGAAHAAQRLIAGGRWSLAYFDGISLLLLPAGRDPSAWIAGRDLHGAGLDRLRADAAPHAAAIDAGRRLAPPPRLLGAGVALSALGHPAEALAIFRSVLRGDPSMTPLGLNVGITAMAAGRPAEALPVLQTFVARFPSSPQGWAALAEALRAGGRTNDATDALRKAEARKAR
ncbi:MAG: hypothetical protein FJ221_10935 [Lentisphaerae bacterium]|nr:hypothetical protein [Lentisphaerota bacterium]